VKDLYFEKYKPLKKQIEEDIGRWKYLPYSWIGRINIVKMTVLPKAIYMFNAILIKILMTFITEIENIKPKFHMEAKKTANSQGNSEQKEQCERNHSIYFKLHYRAIAIKAAWYWHKNRHKDEWNRIKDTDLNPHNSHQIFFLFF
jgi:hypothetical protein